jgi:hypothetical protein
VDLALPVELPTSRGKELHEELLIYGDVSVLVLDALAYARTRKSDEISIDQNILNGVKARRRDARDCTRTRSEICTSMREVEDDHVKLLVPDGLAAVEIGAVNLRATDQITCIGRVRDDAAIA